MQLRGKTKLRWTVVYWKALAACAVLVILALVLFLIGATTSQRHPVLCGQVLPAVASVLMTSGVFAVMYEVFVRRNQTDFVLEALELKESMIQAGLIGLSTNYMDYDYGGQIKAAHNITVFVLYGQTWFGRYHSELTEHLCKDGCTLTLCVPAFDNAHLAPLAERFQYTVDELKRRISEAVTSCAILGLTAESLRGAVRVYMHRARPAYSLYIFDDRLMIGTYYAASSRRRAPMFEFKDQPGSMFAEFEDDLRKVVTEDSELIFDSRNDVNKIEEVMGPLVTESFKRAIKRRSLAKAAKDGAN